MKRKALIITVFLVTGLVFSNFLAISSLSLTKQIKSTFSEEKNLGQEIERPSSGEGRTINYEKGVYYEGTRFLTFVKERFPPFEAISTGDFLKGATRYSASIILLLVISYFLRKLYKKKRKKSSEIDSKIEEGAQKQPKVIEKNVGIDILPFTRKKPILATNIQIHESRKLLQQWEARLDMTRMKREAETINEWFERINGPKEIIPIYERVRYGEKNCTEEELRFMKNTFKL